MYFKPLLFPLFVQVGLTFTVMLIMYSKRVTEFKQKRIHPNTVPTRQHFREKMSDSANSADNFMNLFETPVLFYTAIILSLTLLLQDPLVVSLCWLYVGLRIIHSLIHVTYNRVMHRFLLFCNERSSVDGHLDTHGLGHHAQVGIEYDFSFSCNGFLPLRGCQVHSVLAEQMVFSLSLFTMP